MADKSYLKFEEESFTGKTYVWHIMAADAFLGAVRWYAPWRRYCYFPAKDILLDSGCLKEITKFIDAEMQKRKK